MNPKNLIEHMILLDMIKEEAKAFEKLEGTAFKFSLPKN